MPTVMLITADQLHSSIHGLWVPLVDNKETIILLKFNAHTVQVNQK
jgi:hypothetical protein